MNIINRLFLSAFFLLLVFIIPVQAEEWPTTQFKIVQEHPYDIEERATQEAQFELGLAEEPLRISPKKIKLDYNLIPTLETYIQNVAKDYKFQGFKAPAIDDRVGLIGLDSKKVGPYKIYLINYEDKDFGTAFYSARCFGMSEKNHRYIMVDSSRVMTAGGKISPTVYNDLAHELFHAIQGSYEFFHNNCKLGDWIYEGTATAIGQDLAVNHSGGSYTINHKEWGIRPYKTSLRVPDLIKSNENRYTYQEGHSTAGFWRYIGEYITNNKTPSSKQKNKPDYRYLIRLFKRKISKAGENRELNWLDRGLRKELNTGLNGIYSSFISTFIHYSPDRFGDKTQKGISNWYKCLFSGTDCKTKSGLNRLPNITDPCTEYTITPSKVLEIILEIKKAASRCFKLKASGGNRWDVDIGMQLAPTDLEQLNKLWIGTKVIKDNKIAFDVNPGVTPDYSTNSSTNSTSSAGFTSWSFRLTSLPQIFVVSNMAEKPSETKKVSFTLQIAIPSTK